MPSSKGSCTQGALVPVQMTKDEFDKFRDEHPNWWKLSPIEMAWAFWQAAYAYAEAQK